MIYHSLLYETAKDRTREEALEAPPFFADLNLDQVIEAITAGKQQYDLKPFFFTPLSDVGTIQYRHEIMQDLEDETLLESVNAFAQRMVIVRRYLALVEKLDFANHKEGWFLEAVQAYYEAVTGLAHEMVSSRCSASSWPFTSAV